MLKNEPKLYEKNDKIKISLLLGRQDYAFLLIPINFSHH